MTREDAEKKLDAAIREYLFDRGPGELLRSFAYWSCALARNYGYKSLTVRCEDGKVVIEPDMNADPVADLKAEISRN